MSTFSRGPGATRRSVTALHPIAAMPTGTLNEKTQRHPAAATSAPPSDGPTRLATEIVAKKLSVRDAEKLVARSQVNGRQAPLLRVKKEKRGDIARLEEQLADRLAAAVEIRMLKKTRHGESGEIAIAFGSLDELGGLLERLGLVEER